MNIFERVDNWLAKCWAKITRRKYLRYTRTLEQMVRARGVDQNLFTCTLAHQINKEYGLWYRSKLDEYFWNRAQICSLTPFHRFVGYSLKRWERDEVVYQLRLEFIDQLVKELECMP